MFYCTLQNKDQTHNPGTQEDDKKRQVNKPGHVDYKQ